VAPDVRPYEPPPAPAPAQQGAYYWQPAEGERVYQQEPPPADSGVRLGPPVAADREPSRVRPRAAEPNKPIVREERDRGPSSLPVGIPQFALARENVASGLRPSIDGLDWLKDNGYKTVLHVIAQGADDSADEKQVTKRGLKYLRVEASPQTLNKTAVEAFGRAVADPKNAPLFVYDKDGMIAGGLWYLYFKTGEKDSDEAARIKAARLGLQEDPRGEHKTMWLAIQKYLSDEGR
jgi:protein tyrosine phosphatase (PTP) superfamily phosphohydrolase (DUF442 family)